MFRVLKQKLDQWAINLASNALPAGRHDPGRLREAAELLESDQLLALPAVAADLIENADGTFHFASAIKTGLPRNDLVHGKLFRAGSAWRTKPLVILVHGWNAELHYLHVLPRLARALNRSGMNAALVELPLHLQRRPPREAGCVRDFISDDVVAMLRATRQAVADFHALAGWARKQGCPQVGLWGFSLGAWLAGLYICRERRVSHAVLTTPIISLERAVRELPFCHPIRAALGDTELGLAKLNLAAQKPVIASERIRVCQSDYDVFVPGETYRELADAWDLTEIRSCAESHLTVLISRKPMRATVDWLAEQFTAAAATRPSATPSAAAA